METAEKKTTTKKAAKYYQATGGRKTASARIRITPSKSKSFLVNDRTLEDYFPTIELQKTVQEPLERAGDVTNFTITAVINGGGMTAQAEAMRHGIARALVSYDSELRTLLKKFGFLKRDPRMRERKKFGLKRARRARQWRKR